MSHLMTALAMRQEGLKPAAKIVLYWLADHHNSETGLCCPSLSTLAAECEMDKTTVSRHLKLLEDVGLISRNKRLRDNGSHTSTSYELSIKQPVAKCTNPIGKMPIPPVAKCPTLNLGNNNLGNELKETPKSILCEYAGDESVSSFLEYRRKSKGGSISVTAAKRVSNHLEAIVSKGGSADDALGMAEENGWKTVQPDWYFNKKNQKSNGGRVGYGLSNGDWLDKALI